MQRARVLLIRSWTAEVAPVVTALRAAGIDAAITQIDREPALNAALARERFDVVVFDPAILGLSRTIVEACLRTNERAIPVVDLGPHLGREVARLIQRD